MSVGVQKYCHIKNNRIYLDGRLYFEDLSTMGLKSFAVKAFRESGIKYPKFYKMDDISKLGFLAAELLMQSVSKSFLDEEVGIVLSNSHSTLITDSKFQESVSDDKNFFPSPAVFVYTLPNIMIGEISIRHKLRGENAFFIFDRFNAKIVTGYINRLFSAAKLKYCIGGWVDQSVDSYEAFLYWAEPFTEKSVAVEHNEQEIEKLYGIK